MLSWRASPAPHEVMYSPRTRSLNWRSRSRTRTLAPRSAMPFASAAPPRPPPTMTRSSTSGMSSPPRLRRGVYHWAAEEQEGGIVVQKSFRGHLVGADRGLAGLQSLEDHRSQLRHAARSERQDHLAFLGVRGDCFHCIHKRRSVASMWMP